MYRLREDGMKTVVSTFKTLSIFGVAVTENEL